MSAQNIINMSEAPDEAQMAQWQAQLEAIQGKKAQVPRDNQGEIPRQSG